MSYFDKREKEVRANMQRFQSSRLKSAQNDQPNPSGFHDTYVVGYTQDKSFSESHVCEGLDCSEVASKEFSMNIGGRSQIFKLCKTCWTKVTNKMVGLN
jgi:hypothetical protein